MSELSIVSNVQKHIPVGWFSPKAILYIPVNNLEMY